MPMEVQGFSSGAVDNAVGTCTLTAAAGTVHITRIFGGYSAAPAADLVVTIEVDGVAEDVVIPVTAAGLFDLGVGGEWVLRSATSGVKLKIPASGTAGITGTVNCFARVRT